MLTVKIVQAKGEIDEAEWRYFLAGPVGDIKVQNNPTEWISESSWPELYKQMYGMDHLPKFKGFLDFFMKNSKLFKDMYDSANAHQCPLPPSWNSKLNEFQKIIVTKAIRNDKVCICIYLISYL